MTLHPQSPESLSPDRETNEGLLLADVLHSDYPILEVEYEANQLGLVAGLMTAMLADTVDNGDLWMESGEPCRGPGRRIKYSFWRGQPKNRPNAIKVADPIDMHLGDSQE